MPRNVITLARHAKHVLLLLPCAACNPLGSASTYDMGTATITSRVVNPRTVIHLGDSVALYFQVADSVRLNGVRTAVSVGGKDGGDVEFSINKINRLGGSGYDANTASCKLYANPGTLIRSSAVEFAYGSNRLVSKLYLIPTAKGIYFFDQGPPGYLALNNQKLQVRCGLDFGNVNRNIQLLVDSAGTTSNLGKYLQGERNNGWEVYGFRVI